MSEAEQRRCEDIIKIQTLLLEGYAPVQMKEILHTTYFRIRRYATGDPFKLCSFEGNKESKADRYREPIVNMLTQNVSLKYALEQVSALGYQGKRSAFEAYCRKLISETGISYVPKRNAAGTPIAPHPAQPTQRYVSKKEILRYLWSGKELNPDDTQFIMDKYPQVSVIQQCILDFRNMYREKSIPLLMQFIEKYAVSENKSISSFASGLRTDLDAVMNSVTSELSNGFVEGNNNKIKAIKRTMYGRAKIDLLRVKVLYAR